MAKVVFSLPVRLTAGIAKKEAEARGHEAVSPRHLLYAIALRQPDLLGWAQENVQNLVAEFGSPSNHSKRDVALRPDKETSDVIVAAVERSLQLSHHEVEIGDLIWAMHEYLEQQK